MRDQHEPSSNLEVAGAKSHSRLESSYSCNYSVINMYDCPSPADGTPVRARTRDDVDLGEIIADSDRGEIIADSDRGEMHTGRTRSIDGADDHGVGKDGEGKDGEGKDGEGKSDDVDETNESADSSAVTSTDDIRTEPNNSFVGGSSSLSLARNSNISVSTRSSIPSESFSNLSISEPADVEQILKSNFDRYGFKKVSSYHSKITIEGYNSWFTDYSVYLSKNKKKWLELMKSNGLSGTATNSALPTRFPPKSDKVKKLIRKGIPAEWRGNAWFFYAGGYEKLNKHTGVYEQIVRDTDGVHTKDTEVIERDLNRTFPDNIYFNKNLQKQSDDSSPQVASETQNIKALRRVLTAFAHYQPHIGYCQSLNFLAGLLLLFMREERAFWMLVILTERIIPKVHSANLEGVHIDQGVLMLCIKEYIPQLWHILGKNFEGETLSEDKILTRLPPVTLVTSSWFMSVFVGILPIETTLRVWDILWYEGSKSIFRISLTICKMCLEDPEFQQPQQRGSNGGEIEQIELFQFMQQFPKSILEPNLLIDNCFKKIGGYGFGLLSQDEINKCRDFVSKQRLKLKKKTLATEMSEDERIALESSGEFEEGGDDIHDVYGFHRSIMSGVAWNKNISNRMKKKFTRVASK